MLLRLQAVDPVLVGKVRAKQYYSDDHDRTRNLGILLHGDGSFSGQGVVYETLDMSALPDYTVGGVIHIVVNNQVRFMRVYVPMYAFIAVLQGCNLRQPVQSSWPNMILPTHLTMC